MPIFTLEELLSPFEFLDVPSLYDRYSSAIDFTIAFLLFLGVAKVTLGKRFEGRGGKLITVSVALALSIGFSLMERQMNFSLRSSGPLGGFILIFLVSIVLFSLFRTTGMSHTSSFCLAYIVVYISLRLISPTIFDWIAGKAPFINGILGLAFIVSGIKLILSLFHRRSLENLPTKLRVGNPLQSEVEHELEEEEIEKKLVKTKMRKLTKKDLKKSEQILGYLKHILQVIGDYGNTTQGRERISKELKKISEAEHYILGKLDFLEKLNSKIERHDSVRLRELENKYNAASGKEKDLLNKEIDIEYKKIKTEEQIGNLKEKILKLTQGFNTTVKAAMNSLSHNYPQDAQKFLEQTIKFELAINQSFSDINKLEKFLRKLIGKEEKILKHQT